MLRCQAGWFAKRFNYEKKTYEKEKVTHTYIAVPDVYVLNHVLKQQCIERTYVNQYE